MRTGHIALIYAMAAAFGGERSVVWIPTRKAVFEVPAAANDRRAS